MSAGKGPQKTQEEIEMEQMAQAELARLQRQYRIMEEDRAHYAEETRILLNRQRRQILALEREKKQLLMSPEYASLKVARRRASSCSRLLERQLDKYEEMDERIQEQKEKNDDLREKIRQVEKEIEHLRKKSESDICRKEALKSVERNESLLKNRLHHASVHLNSITADNRTLRADLNHLLLERAQFNVRFEKLAQHLVEGKKLASELTDAATQAYDQREEAQSRLQMLKEQEQIDVDRFKADMNVLQRQLDSVAKLFNFLATKGQKRTTAHLEAQEALRQINQREAMEKLLQAYASSLKEIQEFCGEQVVDKLAALFTKQEEENFALFNYVNELNSELEALEDKVETARRQLDAHHRMQKRQEQQRQDNLAELQTALEATQRRNKDADAELETADEELGQLLQKVKRLFNLVFSDPPPILQLIGGDPEVSSENVSLYLELLQENAASIRETALKTFDPEQEEESSTTHSIAPKPHKQRASFPMFKDSSKSADDK
ncbi:outer dynein arm-docking complex subunit 1 [Neocloeon triangulifer]|uniref:outer dynein arm-docking complex subunit 1 n=1 Tax=Neocloeon triangulifer TaxID=2078957 RepID=UPI00286F642E|nr:outer dynein arm-docking complex subunit 1 [Neocloeon triangulifer]